MRSPCCDRTLSASLSRAARGLVISSAVGARAFPPDTARSIAALDPRDRRREFLRAWARHEAALKCRGGGLARAGRHGHTDSGTGPQRALQDPWVGDLPLMPGAAAALASAATPRHVRCWTCTP